MVWLASTLVFYLCFHAIQGQSIVTEDFDSAYARCAEHLTSCKIDNLSLHSKHGTIQFVGALSFIGSSSDSKVELNGTLPLVLMAGEMSLISASIYGASFVLDPPVPHKDISLSGIPIVAGAQLVIANSSIYLDCDGWSTLFDVLCDHGLAPGNVKVSMHVLNYLCNTIWRLMKHYHPLFSVGLQESYDCIPFLYWWNYMEKCLATVPILLSCSQ